MLVVVLGIFSPACCNETLPPRPLIHFLLGSQELSAEGDF